MGLNTRTPDSGSPSGRKTSANRASRGSRHWPRRCSWPARILDERMAVCPEIASEIRHQRTRQNCRAILLVRHKQAPAVKRLGRAPPCAATSFRRRNSWARSAALQGPAGIRRSGCATAVFVMPPQSGNCKPRTDPVTEPARVGPVSISLDQTSRTSQDSLVPHRRQPAWHGLLPATWPSACWSTAVSHPEPRAVGDSCPAPRERAPIGLLRRTRRHKTPLFALTAHLPPASVFHRVWRHAERDLGQDGVRCTRPVRMRFLEDRKLARAGAPLPCKVLHGPMGWNSSVMMIVWSGSLGRCRCGCWPSGAGCALGCRRRWRGRGSTRCMTGARS